MENITYLPIQDSFTSSYSSHKDNRGIFNEIANASKNKNRSWNQINISTSNAFVLRGIHVSPYGKLVSCIKGEMYDYVIDLRQSSPTFLMWTCISFHENDGKQVYIPEGCGHAFISGSSGCTVLYCQEGIFNAEKDLNVAWNDPVLGIQWNMDKEKQYIISEKDKKAPLLQTIQGYEYVIQSKPVSLIIGGNSQIGRELINQLQTLYVCIGTYASKENRNNCQVQLDLKEIVEDKSKLFNLLEMIHPEVIFLCSALTNVNECNKNPDECNTINSKAPTFIAEECKQRNIKLVFFSTDYVFNGNGGPYMENDSNDLNPLNAYGIAKLSAEQNILKENPKSLIVRTTGVYGPDFKKQNFVYQVLKHVIRKEQFLVSNDQIANPIFTEDLVQMTLKLISGNVQPGIYNIAGPNHFSKYEFALKIVEGMGLRDECKTLIVPCSTQEIMHSNKNYVERPKNSGLVVQKIFQEINENVKIRSINEVLLKVWNPFNDITVEKIWYAPYKFQAYDHDETFAVQKCLSKGWISPGPLTFEFESKISNYFGKQYGVMVNSGSSANMLALAVLNLNGKEAITPACTFATCIAPMEQLGIKPVFIDVELKTYVPSVESILSAITPETGCIFIPNLIGSKINWKELRQRLPRPDIWLVEDSCDTMTFTKESDISITSFYASHVITAGGCGGMVMFNDHELTKKAFMYRDWGRMGTNSEDFGERFHNSSVDGIPYDFKFLYGVVGYNFKCCEMNAAFGLEQFKKLDLFQCRRKQNVDRFMQRLKNTNYILPNNHEKYDWLAFPLMSDQRTKLLQYLEENNVQVRVCFAGNITRHPAFRHHFKEFPNSDIIMQQGFLLGAHHGLSMKDIDRCCDLLISFENTKLGF